MEAEIKYPIKYVARAIIEDGWGERPKSIAYYVAQAYLLAEIKEYNIDGSSKKKYAIHFSNERTREIHNIEQSYFVLPQYSTFREMVFDDYSECKKYVEELNVKTLKCNQMYTTRKKEEAEKFNRVIKYAERLEREDLNINQNSNNY